MKKQLVVLGALLAAVIAFGTAAQAATAVAGSARAFTAQAITGGTLKAEFGIKLRPASDPEGVAADLTQINWSGVNPGMGWKIADAVLRTTWTVTDAGGGITIYTDNTHASASPRFVDSTPADIHNVDSNPAGLLMGASGNSNTTLPLAWSIKASSQVVGSQIIAANPNLIGTDVNAPQWFFMLDKATPGIDRDGDGYSATDPQDTLPFNYGGSFTTMIKNSGIHYAQSDDASNYGADPDFKSYVYLQADFTTAAAQTTYKTSRLTVEAYLQ